MCYKGDEIFQSFNFRKGFYPSWHPKKLRQYSWSHNFLVIVHLFLFCPFTDDGKILRFLAAAEVGLFTQISTET